MTPNDFTLPAIARARKQLGMLFVEEILQLAETNTILDPFSLLISRNVQIGINNVFYPCVVLQSTLDGILRIGDDNSFMPGTFVLVDVDGRVEIGNNNEFGDGGITIKANRVGAEIIIGSNGRYFGGPQIFGASSFGDGTQILGPITVVDCILEGGEDHRHPDADARGAVLKGTGVAKAISLRKGEVLAGFGPFDKESVERQVKYHPRNSI